jgi:putative hydrolase of the HAD superfamily
MIKAIFFDAAGTLIFLPRSVGEHYREVAARFGADLSAMALEQAFRRAWAAAPVRGASPGPRADDDKGWWRELVARVLEETLTAGQRAFFPRAAYFEALYTHFAEPGVWALYPEAVEVLTALRDGGYRLGVISNFDRRLEVILAGLGVGHLFECVVLSSQAGADKPDPRIFLCALRTLGVAPAQALHVGDDRERDGGAEALGIRVFHLDRPGTTLRDLARWMDRLPSLPAAAGQEDLPGPGNEAK